MFDLGFQELLVIFLIALLVFGPKKLPELGRTLGKWFGEIRKGFQNTKTQIEAEFNEIEKEQADEIYKLHQKEERGNNKNSDNNEKQGKI